MMAFRVGGALESLQQQYFLLNLCFSMVTFDLQAQVTQQWAPRGPQLKRDLREKSEKNSITNVLLYMSAEKDV